MKVPGTDPRPYTRYWSILPQSLHVPDEEFQVELIKTMSPEQLKVIQQWFNEILATGEIVTKVTEEDMTGVLSLLHKGDPLTDQPSYWRPVVFSTL